MVDKKDEMKDRKDEETPEEETSQEETSEASEEETPQEETPQEDEQASADSDTDGDEEAEEASASDAAPAEDSSDDSDTEEDSVEDSAEDEASEEEPEEEASQEEEPSEEEAVEDEDPHQPPAEEQAVEESEVASTASVASAAPEGSGDLEGIAAFFEHPKHLMAAATYARDSDYEEFEAYSPFPIHGMDEAMGLGRSWIPWVTFGAGLTGFVLANVMQFGMMTFDWPMIIGGKPYAPWPSFVPIMFELTVLLAGVTTAVVMLKAAGCFQKPMIIDPSITDDRFVLWISAKDNKFDVDEVIEFFEDLRPLEVRKIVKDA